MPIVRAFYFDHAAARFVEVAPSRRHLWVQAAWVGVLSLALSVVGAFALSGVTVSPLEAAQAEEIQHLRGRLGETGDQIAALSGRLGTLAARDREVYRAVLEAPPISEAEFEMGVGGAVDERLRRFPEATAEAAARVGEAAERLERQLELQRLSYVEVRALASDRDATLRQQPAILPLRDARITSGFGFRHHPVLGRSKLHTGIDFGAPLGTPIHATADGVVSYVGVRGGYGNVVEIEHPLVGRLTRFAHLTSAAPGLVPGLAVRRGQTVAYSGNTGMSTGPHLHYEVRLLDSAQTPLDPAETFVEGVTPEQYRQLLADARAPSVTFH